jgi:hypothetical protein
MGTNRVKRGGSWNNNAQNCRVANRNNNNPGNSNNNNGFRVARSSITRMDVLYIEPAIFLSFMGKCFFSMLD